MQSPTFQLPIERAVSARVAGLEKTFLQAMARVAGAQVGVLGAGESVVVDARYGAFVSVITGTGATGTVSRVDSLEASEHTTGTENSFDVAANSLETFLDWPFYRISVAGGSLRYAVG